MSECKVACLHFRSFNYFSVTNKRQPLSFYLLNNSVVVWNLHFWHTVYDQNYICSLFGNIFRGEWVKNLILPLISELKWTKERTQQPSVTIDNNLFWKCKYSLFNFAFLETDLFVKDQTTVTSLFLKIMTNVQLIALSCLSSTNVLPSSFFFAPVA